MKRKYRYYKFEGVFELPRGTSALKFMLKLIKLVEKFGGYVGGGLVEVNEDGKAVRHGKA